MDEGEGEGDAVAAFLSSFPQEDLAVAAAEVGVVVAAVVGAGAVVEGSADSAAVAGSVAVVAGRAGDENSEP
jgi:hypothetical protein